MRYLTSSAFIVGLMALSLNVNAQIPNNLSDRPTTARFQITDRQWPTEKGEAHVCLWADDKMATVGFNIDDNVKFEHSWWLEQMDKYGWKVTWFVITSRTGVGQVYYGEWDDFRTLYSYGHSIQSHSVNHDFNGDVKPDAYMHNEYSQSKAILESEIPGNRCLTLAYPNGKGKSEVAKDYYIAARGVMGHPIRVNRAWYLWTWNGDVRKQTVDKIIDGGPTNQFWRGWANQFYHDVFHDGEQSEKEILELEAKNRFNYVKSREKDLWVDVYMHQAQYGQERDTHTLNVTDIQQNSITFSLTDQMRNDWYDFPLTVKVCLGTSWTGGATATQNGSQCETRVEVYNGIKYALVKAIPDKGNITLVSTTSLLKVTSIDEGGLYIKGSTHSITWDQEGVTGNVSIELHRLKSGKVLDIGNVSVSSGSYEWTIPENLDEAYDYRIKISGADTSDFSNTTFSIRPAGLDQEAPSKTPNLHATLVQSTQIDIAWDSATDNNRVVGYRVYRKDSGHLKSISEAKRSYVSAWLHPGTTYRYTVRAIDAAGNEGPPSDTLVVTIPLEGVPATPGNLQISRTN